jgi:hypothetical protein
MEIYFSFGPVGIATGYGLDNLRVRVRIPVRARIVSSPRLFDQLCGPLSLHSFGVVLSRTKAMEFAVDEVSGKFHSATTGKIAPDNDGKYTCWTQEAVRTQQKITCCFHHEVNHDSSVMQTVNFDINTILQVSFCD